MLEVQQWRSGVGGVPGLRAGCNQLALPLGLFHLRGVFVHITTPEDYRSLHLEHLARNLWFHDGRWFPKYEVSDSVVDISDESSASDDP